MQTTGSKAQVFHGTAKHTSGGLEKKDLMKNKHGRIVSRRKHALGAKSIKRLRALGFVAKKGTFKIFRRSDAKKATRRVKKGKKGTRKMRGGNFFAESGSSGSA
jgi:hypothetical protein